MSNANPSLVLDRSLGNFVLVVPSPIGGLVQYWRNNNTAELPWIGPLVFGTSAGTVDAVSLIQSNFVDGHGPQYEDFHLEVVARIGSHLAHFWRDSVYAWHGPSGFGSLVSGVPSLVQSRFGARGNFEVVVPSPGGGLAHYWRNNDADGFPWSGPTVFGTSAGNVDAVSLIQSNFGSPGNLEVVARIGTRLAHFWRDSGPSLAWHASPFFGSLASGVPSLVQSRFGNRGNFEVVVPSPGGGLAHYWRNNDADGFPWSGPTVFGTSAGNVDAVSLIQSHFGASGNLEVVARIGRRLAHFWRDSGPSFDWHGPTFFVSL